MRSSFVLLMCIAAAACGGSDSSNVFDTGGGKSDGGGKNDTDGGGGNNGGDDGGISFGDGSTSTGNTGDCSEEAKLIYVLSAENDLYSFQPIQKKFTKIGPLGCKTSMTPNSMAISRDATAWVNYVQADPLGGDTAGSVFKVSTKDASCQPTSISLQQNWYRLGMGFSTDSATSTSETLYVAATGDALGGLGGQGSKSPGLGKIDLAGQSLSPIGSFGGKLDGQNAELTGTGDGRLFGFFIPQQAVFPGQTGGGSVSVAQIDKGSGAASNDVQLTSVEIPSYWAFSFWGGDFYLYTAPGPDPNNPDPNQNTRTTNVTRYRPSDGSTDTAYMTEIGFRIVGAGVSTCAPLAIPK